MPDLTGHNILVVDDENSVRQSLKKVLQREGHNVLEAANGKAARRCLDSTEIALVISDMNMPEMNGMELLRSLRTSHPESEFIMITGHGTIEKAVEAMRIGAYDFITKPFKRMDILHVVDKALERHQLAMENRSLKNQLKALQSERHNFVGNSRSAQEIRSLIGRIAPTPSNVLISGESGTGKEVVARLIHENSERARDPFMAVNCGAIPDNLIESELFGHVKGSFTGAVKDKEGLFRAAAAGTLFLDEISTIPVNLQVKLLRVLEEQEIMPVGSTKTLPVKARILAATNRDLQREVQENRFREDLYFRLNVIELRIPPLRERRDDIMLLAAWFIERMNKELNKKVKAVTPAAQEYLLNHDWPGNVRELENVIERAMIFCDDEHIESHHLPPELTRNRDRKTPQNLRQALDDFERRHILNVLEAHGGDKKEAASALGLGLSSLYRKMNELDIKG